MPQKPFHIMHRKPIHVLNTTVLPLDIKDDGFSLASDAAVLKTTVRLGDIKDDDLGLASDAAVL